jgi:AcrB/AcrD/AcrF family
MRGADNLAAKGNQQPGLVGLFNGFRARTLQLYVDVDREKVKTMGVQLTDVFDALQAYLGSFYTNDFNRFGRTWQVNIQADAPFRTDAETIKQLKVRNADGDMVPLGAVADVRDSAGPFQITRYNMFPAAPVSGASLPGNLLVDRVGKFGVRINNGAYFDAQQRRRELRDQLKRLVQVPGIDNGEPAQAFLGLGEGPIGNGQLAVPLAHGPGGPNGLKAGRENVVSGLLKFLGPGGGAVALGDNRGQVRLRNGVLLLVVNQAGVFHCRLPIRIRIG